MNYYRYKILEKSGGVSSGVIKLPYQEVMSAVAYLERNGGYTIYVRKLGRLGRLLFQLTDKSKTRRLKRPLQAELLNNMALMLRAGMPLTSALEEVASGDDMQSVAAQLQSIIESVKGGISFSDSAVQHTNIFPKNVIHLIRMGEDTGKLDEMLKDAADHLTRMQQIISDTKQALIYPFFVMTAMTGGLIFWFAFVVPKITSLFKEMNVTLPAITVFLIRVSDFVQAYLLHMLIGMAALVALLVTGYRYSPSCKQAMDKVSLRLPVVGSIITASTLAYITEYFAILINAGIDILHALSILQASISNAVYKQKLGLIHESLQRGEGVGEGFKKALIFPSFVIRMVGIGERSGTLPDQLGHIATEYRRKLTILVDTIGKLIEPAVLIMAGVIFAVIVMGLFLPIYDLVSQVGSY